MSEQKVIKGDYQKALTSFTQALRTFRRGEYDKVEELLQEFLEKHSEEKELVDRAHVYLKICENKKKRTTISLKTFDDYYFYGTLKMNEKDYQEALKLLNKALEMKPQEGKVYYMMSAIHCLLGEADNCLEYLKKAIQIDKHFQVMAQNESDFESLWEDKKFILITRMK